MTLPSWLGWDDLIDSDWPENGEVKEMIVDEEDETAAEEVDAAESGEGFEVAEDFECGWDEGLGVVWRMIGVVLRKMRHFEEELLLHSRVCWA